MANRGLLIVLSGPSGVGKGSIRRRLFMREDIDLSYSISMTTREPRNGEIDGVDYFFVSQQEFKENVEKGNLLEYAKFVGNYYGTPKNYVEKLLNNGKNVFLEIEIEGARQVVEKMKDAVTIYLMPPSIEELERRIRGRRSEPEEVVKERMDKAKREIKSYTEYKYVVYNDSLEKATEEIANIILNEINKEEVL
jgi:guanylate kinase